MPTFSVETQYCTPIARLNRASHRNEGDVATAGDEDWNTMNLVARRVLLGSVTAFCLLIACGGGVNPAGAAANETALSADGTCGPCGTDSDCQNGCGSPAVGYSTWCCALNSSPTSCYNWQAASCPSTTTGDAGGSVVSGGGSSGGSSGGALSGNAGATCVGKACGADGGGVSKRPCRGKKCGSDAGI